MFVCTFYQTFASTPSYTQNVFYGLKIRFYTYKYPKLQTNGRTQVTNQVLHTHTHTQILSLFSLNIFIWVSDFSFLYSIKRF